MDLIGALSGSNLRYVLAGMVAFFHIDSVTAPRPNVGLIAWHAVRDVLPLAGEALEEEIIHIYLRGCELARGGYPAVLPVAGLS